MCENSIRLCAFTCHYQILTALTAAQPPIERFPSADGDHHLQNHQKGAC